VISYFQAIVIGLFQGVTELVPISSLGHSVLLPELLGWDDLAKAQSSSESFYLAFLVALHVATALALLLHYRATWARIIKGFFTSIGKRKIDNPDERLAWLLVAGTIPVGVIGLVFEHPLRTVFAKPEAAAAFLILNGVILYLGERLRRRPAAVTVPADGVEAPGRQLDRLELREGGVIGAAQSLALFAGISRSGVTMVGGLLRGLNHEDAARFSFLLATPVILAAGVYKIPDLTGPLGDGVRGQALAGGVAAFIAAYGAVRFLERWFERQTLTPFAVYCVLFGGFSLAYLTF
jgi:undecaprenyl-diphosphatase